MESIEEKLEKCKANGGLISTTKGMSGYFAVHYWWNKEHNGFWEPYDTGFGRYATQAEAEEEAQSWAKDSGLPYIKGGDK